MPVSAPADRVIAAKLPNDLIVRLREAAREADRTLSGQIRRVVREWADSDAAQHDVCRESGGE